MTGEVCLIRGNNIVCSCEAVKIELTFQKFIENADSDVQSVVDKMNSSVVQKCFTQN